MRRKAKATGDISSSPSAKLVRMHIPGPHTQGFAAGAPGPEMLLSQEAPSMPMPRGQDHTELHCCEHPAAEGGAWRTEEQVAPGEADFRAEKRCS